MNQAKVMGTGEKSLSTELEDRGGGWRRGGEGKDSWDNQDYLGSYVDEVRTLTSDVAAHLNP